MKRFRYDIAGLLQILQGGWPQVESGVLSFPDPLYRGGGPPEDVPWERVHLSTVNFLATNLRELGKGHAIHPVSISPPALVALCEVHIHCSCFCSFVFVGGLLTRTSIPPPFSSDASLLLSLSLPPPFLFFLYLLFSFLFFSLLQFLQLNPYFHIDFGFGLNTLKRTWSAMMAGWGWSGPAANVQGQTCLGSLGR